MFALPPTSTGLAISQPFLTYGDKGYWPGKDYLGVDDATAIWWDPAATGPDEIRKDGVGMYQFVDGGQRYLPGQWPAADKMFDPTGAVVDLHHPAARRGARQLPEPSRLASTAEPSHAGLGGGASRWGRGRPLPARRWCG